MDSTTMTPPGPYLHRLLESVRLHPVLAVIVVFGVVIYSINRALHPEKYPDNLPFLGEPEGKVGFSWKTRLRYNTSCYGLFKEAYERFSKKGKTVVIPGLGARREIILPHSSIKWLLAQPQSDLGMYEAFAELDQALYSLGDHKYAMDAWQNGLVKNDINQMIEAVAAELNQELKAGFDSRFGTDTENWKEIDLQEEIRLVIAQAVGRFTVGFPLCRDPEYIRLVLEIMDKCVVSSGAIMASPKMLQPITGTLVGHLVRSRVKQLERVLEPLYLERKQILLDIANGSQMDEPKDHFQLMMRFAQRHYPQEFNSLHDMTRRLCAANFSSMQQTTVHATNMILNILASNDEFNTINVLRNEFNCVLSHSSDTDSRPWTKSLASKLIKTDSVARESMRLHAFGGRALFRKVMHDNVRTPDGIRLPKGAMLTVLSQPVHYDEEIHEEPLKYDPFRFSRLREAAATATGTGGTGENAAAVTFVSTSQQHMVFGYGRHACPGRFLVDFEFKMINAYLLSNYDIKFPDVYEGKRPENKWVMEAVLPPVGAKICVRRRV